MTVHHLIREYKTADFNEILGLFDENCPEFFHPSERKGLVKYLLFEREQYFVVEENQKIVGAGGINFSVGKSVAILSWDFIRPSFQGKGLGQKLLAYRLEYIRSLQAIESISVRTSQFADKFYAKSGFTEIDRKKDYWSQGFDLVEMRLDI